ncbi:hypothetical protein D3C81_2138720 [compost metagenome]
MTGYFGALVGMLAGLVALVTITFFVFVNFESHGGFLLCGLWGLLLLGGPLLVPVELTFHYTLPCRQAW